MAKEFTFTYKLTTPVEFGSKEITEIKYRPPVGRDMHNIRIGTSGEFEMGEFVKLFARISDQPPPFFDEIAPADYVNIMALAADFLGSGQQTG